MVDDFEAVTIRVRAALRHGDWAALRRECGRPIAIVHYARAYPQDYPLGLFDRVFATYSFPKLGEVAPREGRELNHMHLSSITFDPVEPLDHITKRLVRQFLQEARKTLNPPGGAGPAVESGRNIRSGEATFLFGPGIRGKIASSSDWRVQMESVNGRWKVRSLIFDSH